MSIFKKKTPFIESEKAEFEAWLKSTQYCKPSFAELAKKHIESKKLSYTQFMALTGLNKGVYYGIKDNFINPEIETVVTFCVGIGADLSTAEELANAAGFTFKGNETHNFYAFLFNRLRGQSIDKWDEYLLKMGFKPLTKLYRDKNE